MLHSENTAKGSPLNVKLNQIGVLQKSLNSKKSEGTSESYVPYPDTVTYILLFHMFILGIACRSHATEKENLR